MDDERMTKLIKSYLTKFCLGRQGARPRVELKIWLRDNHGINISDRTLRRIYSRMPFVGYAIDGEQRGIFWIANREEALECERLRKSQGKACMAHGADTAKAHGILGQMELPL